MSRSTPFLVGLIVVVVCLCSSCVYSLRPWFGRDALVFDERLLGKWIWVEDDGSMNDDEVVVVERTLWGTYRVSEWGECALGHVGDRHYFDCDLSESVSPTATPWYEGMLGEPMEPWERKVHSLSLITVEKDEVTLRTLDPNKVEKYARKRNSLRGIRVESTDSRAGRKNLKAFLVVSETSELESFLTAHGSADIWAAIDGAYVRAE